MPASAFISHSWNDKALARKLATNLKSCGVRVWLDEAEIRIGDSLVHKIRAGIDSVDYVVALLSPRSCKSEWVLKELDIAMNQEIEGKRVKVLPIMVRKCDLPGFLLGKLYADFSSEKKFEKDFPRLLGSLGVADPIIKGFSEKNNKGESKNKFDLSWVNEFENAYNNSDESAIFSAIASIKVPESKHILREKVTLGRIVDLTGPVWSIHVRVLAIELIGALGEKRFWFYLDNLLDDSSDVVKARAVAAISILGAEDAQGRILDLFSTNNDDMIISECLRYFANIVLKNDHDKEALLSRCRSIDKPGKNQPYRH